MAMKVTKDSIDLGIVIRDSAAQLRFYRDTLGLEHVMDTPLPMGGTMHRLLCGTTLIKLVHLDDMPEAANPPGGLPAATGLRYFTVTVANMQDVLDDCEAGGYNVVWKKREARPGVFVGMVEDPEGNWVELLEGS